MFGTFLFGQGLFGGQTLLSVYDFLFERISVSSIISQEYSLRSPVDTEEVPLSSLISMETEITSIVLTSSESEYGPQ